MNYQFLRTTDTVYCIYFGMSMAYRKIGAAPLKITNYIHGTSFSVLSGKTKSQFKLKQALKCI